MNTQSRLCGQRSSQASNRERDRTSAGGLSTISITNVTLASASPAAHPANQTEMIMKRRNHRKEKKKDSHCLFLCVYNRVTSPAAALLFHESVTRVALHNITFLASYNIFGGFLVWVNVMSTKEAIALCCLAHLEKMIDSINNNPNRWSALS